MSQALHSRRPPVSSSAAPLAFALGSGYLALSFWVLVPRSDLTYISTATSNCQHLFFIFFNSFLAICNHFISKHIHIYSSYSFCRFRYFPQKGIISPGTTAVSSLLTPLVIWRARPFFSMRGGHASPVETMISARKIRRFPLQCGKIPVRTPRWGTTSRFSPFDSI